jgi:antitoxin (DNA-binding transcriptional repressor) of toxin-antitoxin stability system
MDEQKLSTTARDAVHNFTHYAALVDAGAEVIITRRGRASLKLVLAEPVLTQKDRKKMVAEVLTIRSSMPFKGKFNRSEAYET